MTTPSSAPIPSFLISELRRAVIIGAGHGIGHALVEVILSQAPQAQVFATYHRRENAQPLFDLQTSALKIQALDPLNESSLADAAQNISDWGTIDLLINATGFLHNDQFSPERSIASIDLAQLQHTFNVNAFVTPLLAKALKTCMAKDQASAFVALSAMVGSIGENKLGGWHSYRASKTALNMFIKNIAIEFSRTGLPRCSVLAIHPGTTDTDLSRPFSKNVKHQIWTPAESAGHILNTIAKASSEGTGLFKNWDGETIPW